MEIAWTLTALLAAATLGNLYYLGARIDHQAARIDGVIDQLGDVRADMARIFGMFGELRSDIAEMRGEIGDMRGEIGLMRTDLEGHIGDHHTH